MLRILVQEHLESFKFLNFALPKNVEVIPLEQGCQTCGIMAASHDISGLFSPLLNRAGVEPVHDASSPEAANLTPLLWSLRRNYDVSSKISEYGNDNLVGVYKLYLNGIYSM